MSMLEVVNPYDLKPIGEVLETDHTARVDWMPFAGRRHSGYNTGGIEYTMHDMTQDKMAVIKL